MHRAEKQERALSQSNRERHAHETAIQVEQPCSLCCAILVLADNIAEGTSDFLLQVGRVRVGMADAHQVVDKRAMMAVICPPRRNSRSLSRPSSGTEGRQRGPCWSGRTSRSRHPPWRPALRRERRRFESERTPSMRR